MRNKSMWRSNISFQQSNHRLPVIQNMLCKVFNLLRIKKTQTKKPTDGLKDGAQKISHFENN